MDRDLVASAGGDVTVEAVGRHVELPTDEPLGVRQVPLEDGAPLLRPVDEVGGLTRPEPLVVLRRLVVEVHAHHERVGLERLRGWERPLLVGQRLDRVLVLLLVTGARPHPRHGTRPGIAGRLRGCRARRRAGDRNGGWHTRRMSTGLAAAVAEALGADVVSIARLGGGDVAEAFRVSLADGRTVFAKTHRDPPAGLLHDRGVGLAWLREAGAVPVPEVLAVDDGDGGSRPAFLALEWVEEGGRGTTEGEAQLGRELASMHRAGAPCFGREDRRTTGSRALPNDPCDTWVEFFATRRLEPLSRMAADRAALPAAALGKLHTVIGRLAELGGPAEPPARLHGDLWGGNRLVASDGRSWLIDPACHGGHREFDLAMMRLFAGFGGECFDAYDDEHPLADGWEARVPLHQLAPLTVHAIKFGGGYVAATERALDAVLAS